MTSTSSKDHGRQGEGKTLSQALPSYSVAADSTQPFPAAPATESSLKGGRDIHGVLEAQSSEKKKAENPSPALPKEDWGVSFIGATFTVFSPSVLGMQRWKTDHPCSHG